MFGVLALRFRDVLGDIASLLPSFWICVWVGVVLFFAMILYMLVVAWISYLSIVVFEFVETMRVVDFMILSRFAHCAPLLWKLGLRGRVMRCSRIPFDVCLELLVKSAPFRSSLYGEVWPSLSDLFRTGPGKLWFGLSGSVQIRPAAFWSGLPCKVWFCLV